ncbi:M56 family metallopeptidase [Paenibacillus sp. TSA_86.1]|uniref:M56 family metallopeptidase n=1 Tax=Paenibacillus sp. TSA_86.1 TaxID=3415649 RepID=UPI0040465D15
MNIFLELLVALTMAGSMATACILALRFLNVHVFPAHWRYGLSKMAVVFYVLPLSFGIPWFAILFQHTSNTTVKPSDSGRSMFGGIPAPEWTIPSTVAYVLLGAWGVGVLVYSSWQITCYRKFTNELKRTRTGVQENSEAALLLPIMKKKLGIRRHVQLAYSPILRSPVLVGLTKPTIYLPLSGTIHLDMRLVYHHELTHLKQKDLWVKAITLLVSALHWFNPLVHLLRQEIHTWSEFSCDEKVVQKMSLEDRKRYGETILSVMAGARNVPVQFCSSLSGEGKQLKRRLTMMFDVKKMNKKHRMITIGALCLIAVASTSTAVWASNHTPKVESKATEAVPVPDISKKTSSQAAELSVTVPKDEVAEASPSAGSSKGTTVRPSEIRATTPRDEIAEVAPSVRSSRDTSVRPSEIRATAPRDEVAEVAPSPGTSRSDTTPATEIRAASDPAEK